ncbi:class I SAM-dependent methyltransferase [Kineosporia sp. R_H_3]|uniref:class I SAM-dependent methyltransferase n=1 Tax=Kineosporia sp. R_H_3 TaxID=1961848 RepID=UPI000B4B2476|nr:class I SAM-dependent methyltransferase [Kineosporia sp. R_H_3]
MTAEPDDVARLWDAEAATFDDEPDHGLRDPAARAAWAGLLGTLLPPAPARVADLGCGTGTLSVLLAQAGHRVDGVDLSPRMVEAAVRKAADAGVDAVTSFRVGDAAAPLLATGGYDVVLCRHVLWALPDPDSALTRWIRLLAPGGRLVLVEGFWHTGAGLHASDVEALVLRHRDEAAVTPLDDPALWGGQTGDERFAVLSLS